MSGFNRFLAVGLVLVVVVAACSAPDTNILDGITEGKRARDFELQALDGTSVSLSDFEGDVVLVNLWATWCPPCTAEIPDLEDAYRKYKDEGFVILGVNVQEKAEDVAPFVAGMDMTYPILLDEAGKVMSDYRVNGLPMSFIVKRDGTIHVRHLGFLSKSTLNTYLAQVLAAR